MTEQRNPLFDIAPPSETVSIAGVDHKVIGLPLRLIVHSPELMALLMGGNLDGTTLIAKGPETVASVIAGGFGLPDNDEAKKKAADLPLDVQLDLLIGILKATMGGGAGPFVQKLSRLRKLVEAEEEKQPRIFRLKAAQNNSPKSSQPSVPITDGQQEKFGT